MRVLDVTAFYSPVGGGVRTYLRAKARWAAGRGDVEHAVAVAGPDDGTRRWGRSRVHVVAGPPVPASPGYYLLLSARKLRAVIDAEDPDVIEVGSPFLLPWLVGWAARGSGARLVGLLHSDVRRVWIGHGLAGWPGPVRAVADAVLRRWLGAGYRRMDARVASSETGADALRGLGAPVDALVPFGVDGERFHPRRRDPGWWEEVFGGGTDAGGGTGGGGADERPVALYAGRLSREKGLDVVLDALPGLHREAGLRVVLMGDAHLRGCLEAEARRRPGSLAVLPFEADRDRVARALASADLFLAPCPHETFGLAALEAMASGTPVVGADAGGVGELLAGGGGRSFRAGDPEDFRRAVREALRDGEALGQRAREVAEGRTWARTFEGLMGVYEDVLEG